MAVIEGGASLALADVGAQTKGQRVELRPLDAGALGSYRAIGSSGTMAAGLGAAAPILSVRWSNANTMLVHRVALQARNLTTAFAAGVFAFDMIQARAFSVSDTGGGAVLLTTNNAKRKTAFGSSLVTSMLISATATLSAGTRVLDATPTGIIKGNVPATVVNYPFVGGEVTAAGASIIAYNTNWVDLFRQEAGEWPLVYVNTSGGEGFIIRATVPATGTWTFDVLIEWSEVTTTTGYN